MRGISGINKPLIEKEPEAAEIAMSMDDENMQRRSVLSQRAAPPVKLSRML